MSDASHAQATESEAHAVAPEELAARVASKLCHDFISSAQAIISGLDLIDDPSMKDMHDDAMELISTSTRKLVDQLSFARIAFGAAQGVDLFDCAELGRMTSAVYSTLRAELDWAVPMAQLPKAPAQVLANLAQLAAGALPLGGVARLEASQDADGYQISVIARGPKARLHAEVEGGLAGRPLGDGLGGRWVQPYYVAVLTHAAGGTIEAEAADELVTIKARIPG